MDAGRVAQNSTQSRDAPLAEVLDRACQQVLSAWYQNRWPRLIRVHTSIYRAAAEAKANEIIRGNPLALLGLETVGADDVSVDEPEVL